MLHTGNVLIFSGHVEAVHYLAETHVWDPEQPRTTARPVPMPPSVDIFCCFHVSLPDGKVMTAGGSKQTTGNHTVGHALGIRDICIFDPSLNSWTRIGQMSQGRWYPTIVQLGDGSFVIFSGYNDTVTGGVQDIANTVELFKPPFVGSAATPYHPIVLSGANRAFPTYPGLHLAPDGKIYHTGTNWRYAGVPPTGDPTTDIRAPIQTLALTVDTTANTGTWVDTGKNRLQSNREEGNSVLLPPANDGKILVVGGGKTLSQDNTMVTPPRHQVGSNLRAAEILDTRNLAAGWQSAGAGGQMNHGRINCSMVILPDRHVLVLGGTASFKWDITSTPVLTCELYDPIANTFTDVADLHESRTYHSAALLLPSGRVFVAGGVNPVSSGGEPTAAGGTLTYINRKTYELYEPPYFFKTPRPTITNIANAARNQSITAVYHGSQFVIETPDAASIQWVAMMRPGAMTHHTDTQQRYVDITINSRGPGHLLCTAPTDPNLAPPGYYMVWIINTNRMPCTRAYFLKLNLFLGAIPTGIFNHIGTAYEIQMENGFPTLEIGGHHHVHVRFDEATMRWRTPHHVFGTFASLDEMAKYLIEHGDSTLHA
jgi:hypothetical protein